MRATKATCSPSAAVPSAPAPTRHASSGRPRSSRSSSRALPSGSIHVAGTKGSAPSAARSIRSAPSASPRWTRIRVRTAHWSSLASDGRMLLRVGHERRGLVEPPELEQADRRLALEQQARVAQAIRADLLRAAQRELDRGLDLPVLVEHLGGVDEAARRDVEVVHRLAHRQRLAELGDAGRAVAEEGGGGAHRVERERLGPARAGPAGHRDGLLATRDRLRRGAAQDEDLAERGERHGELRPGLVEREQVDGLLVGGLRALVVAREEPEVAGEPFAQHRGAVRVGRGVHERHGRADEPQGARAVVAERGGLGGAGVQLHRVHAGHSTGSGTWSQRSRTRSQWWAASLKA